MRSSPPRWSLALLVLTSGCAWSNPANRPVWNAFEEHVVPRDDATFYATLPLTVPTGLAAILLDTLVVHPLSVVDDAAADAADEWKGLDWQEHYYTELGMLPLRAAWTPCMFAGSWLGRACLDIPPHGSEKVARAAATDAETADTPTQARSDYLAFFAQIAAGGNDPLRHGRARPTWDAELDAAFARALAQTNALGRMQLIATGRRLEMPPLRADPCVGLRDADPVVRYFELTGWNKKTEVPPELRQALRDDPCESVRVQARKRWP